MVLSKNATSRFEAANKQRVTVRRDERAMKLLWPSTVFQCVSIVAMCAVVFWLDYSAWWLLLHLASSVWYVAISQIFLKL